MKKRKIKFSMSKKFLDPTLHDTINYPRTKDIKVNTREIMGKIWVRKAGMFLEFTRFNKEGKSDIERWISK